LSTVTEADSVAVLSLPDYPNLEYHLKKNLVWFGTAQCCVLYGLEVTLGQQRILSVDRLSPDCETVERFVQLCNVHRASLYHLRDLIDDYFCTH